MNQREEISSHYNTEYSPPFEACLIRLNRASFTGSGSIGQTTGTTGNDGTSVIGTLPNIGILLIGTLSLVGT
nr:hypothetical protein Q903MT_gene5204 [Picea sitchensis]